ncbi:MAG: dipeptidase [Phycisphaerales bacterium]
MNMYWVDGHLDLAMNGVTGIDMTQPVLRDGERSISLPDLTAANVTIAFATIFTERSAPQFPYGYADSSDRAGAFAAGLRQLEYYETLETAGHICIIRSRADLGEAVAREGGHPRLNIILLMEGADPIRTPDDVQTWRERGVRIVGLTWARGSRYAAGNAEPGPLSSEGRELISALDACNMIHDCSHLADEALAGLLECATGSVIASHSNCRALLPGDNQRHLTDAAITAIALRKGVIGINLFSKFLADGRRATVQDVVAHIQHIEAVAGSRGCIALGSDADGGFPARDLPVGLDHPELLPNLADALRTDAGWSEAEIRNFASGNWVGFLEHALP